MSAELAARRTAAAAVLTDYGKWAYGEIVTGDWQSWTIRLAVELRSLLEQLDAEPEPGKLAAIRGVLDAFDWERDDRQYALERIEQIAEGSRTASGIDPGGSAVLTPADLLTVLSALADAAVYRGQVARVEGDLADVTAYQALSRALGGR
jgi:hypothetical protein